MMILSMRVWSMVVSFSTVVSRMLGPMPSCRHVSLAMAGLVARDHLDFNAVDNRRGNRRLGVGALQMWRAS